MTMTKATRTAATWLGLSLGLGAAVGLDTRPPALAQANPPASSALERLKAAEIESANLQRAINLARNTAVALNGGLGAYQPGPCMVESRRVKDCLIQRGPEGFVFRFPGGPPGWVAEGKAATIETAISIAADGRSVIKTLYNGAPPAQGSAGAGAAPTCPCVCPAAAPRAERGSAVQASGKPTQ